MVRINTSDPGQLSSDLEGQNANHPVEAVLSGAFAQVLKGDEDPKRQIFSAIDHKLDIKAVNAKMN